MKNYNDLILKNKYFLKANKKFLLNFCWSILISLIAIFSLFLIVMIDDKGFNFNLLFLSYKYILIKIPIVAFCLGVSSFLIQHSSGNRMADTSVLGLGNINSLFVILLVLFLLDNTNVDSQNLYNTLLPFVFIFGSIFASLILFFLSSKKGNQISKKFIIVGILINFFIIGLSTAFSSLLTSGQSQLISRFVHGNLSPITGSPYFLVCGLMTVILLIWIILISNKFKIVSTNHIIAKELGINSNSITMQILIISGGLTGIAYALCGNLVFLGLVAGNIATSIFKKNIKFGAWCSFTSSIVILSLTFWIFESIIPSALNYQIPAIDTVNVVSVICIPYFLYLMFKE